MRAIWGPLSTVTTVRADSAPSLSNTAQSRKKTRSLPTILFGNERYRTDVSGPRELGLWIVAQSNDPPRNIGELIDQIEHIIEHIREELFSIQRSMEKMETLKAAPPPYQAEKR